MPTKSRERERRQQFMDDLLTVAEAARLRGLNESSIRKAIRAAKLTARKVGPVHLVSRAEVLAYRIVGHRPRKDPLLTNRASAR